MPGPIDFNVFTPLDADDEYDYYVLDVEQNRAEKVQPVKIVSKAEEVSTQVFTTQTRAETYKKLASHTQIKKLKTAEVQRVTTEEGTKQVQKLTDEIAKNAVTADVK